MASNQKSSVYSTTCSVIITTNHAEIKSMTLCSLTINTAIIHVPVHACTCMIHVHVHGVHVATWYASLNPHLQTYLHQNTHHHQLHPLHQVQRVPATTKHVLIGEEGTQGGTNTHLIRTYILLHIVRVRISHLIGNHHSDMGGINIDHFSHLCR